MKKATLRSRFLHNQFFALTDKLKFDGVPPWAIPPLNMFVVGVTSLTAVSHIGCNSN